MELYKKSINESDLALEIHIIDANKQDPPKVPQEIIELHNLTSFKIRINLLGMGISMMTIDSNTIRIMAFIYFTGKILGEISGFNDRKEEIALKESIPFYNRLTELALPVIKKQVDNIIVYAGDNSKYSDMELSLAVSQLRNFFIENGWDIEWQLATQKLPYVSMILEEYDRGT